MTSYIVQVQVMKYLTPVTFGNIETTGSEGRSHAKIITVRQQEPWKPFDV